MQKKYDLDFTLIFSAHLAPGLGLGSNLLRTSISCAHSSNALHPPPWCWTQLLERTPSPTGWLSRISLRYGSVQQDLKGGYTAVLLYAVSWIQRTILSTSYSWILYHYLSATERVIHRCWNADPSAAWPGCVLSYLGLDRRNSIY